MTQFTIYITETNYGHISFDTKEEAEEWLNSDVRDFDGVKWTGSDSPRFETDY